jgi:alkylation response protein AidB-like acyl-CoA dehydrogenase
MVQDMIAQMGVLCDVSEKYLYEACSQLIAGSDVSKVAAIAKLFLAQSVMKVADLAVQCHGGYGYTEEYHVERYLRDAKLFEIGAGTSEIQKLIIAKQTLKEYK